jgi:hypothetical protein
LSYQSYTAIDLLVTVRFLGNIAAVLHEKFAVGLAVPVVLA